MKQVFVNSTCSNILRSKSASASRFWPGAGQAHSRGTDLWKSCWQWRILQIQKQDLTLKINHFNCSAIIWTCYPHQLTVCVWFSRTLVEAGALGMSAPDPLCWHILRLSSPSLHCSDLGHLWCGCCHSLYCSHLSSFTSVSVLYLKLYVPFD